MMDEASANKLYEVIGRLTVENGLLRGQVAQLTQQVAAEQEAMQQVLAAKNEPANPPA